MDSSTQSFGMCCRVQGPPGYRVTWLQNGTPLPREDRGYEFGKDYFIFSGPLPNGCAKYTCQVDFPTYSVRKSETTQICYGGMYRKCPLHQYCMIHHNHSDTKPPTVVHITGDTTILENKYATYQCSADGYPEPKKRY